MSTRRATGEPLGAMRPDRGPTNGSRRIVTRILRGLAGSPPGASLVAMLEAIGAHRPDRLTVLTYHRIADASSTPDLHPGLISATPRAFAEQIAFLARRYRVISADDLLQARLGRRPLEPRSILLTFDDAYSDFADNAWPVLRRYDLPATLFVPTAYPGDGARSFWWDRLHVALRGVATRRATEFGDIDGTTEAARARTFRRIARAVKALPHRVAMERLHRFFGELEVPDGKGATLDWASLRRLAADGLTVAPHSRTHPRLDRLAAAELESELAGSIDDLSRELGGAPPLFAYPDGGYDDRVVHAVERAGIQAAFTVRRGANDLRHADWLRLRRINIGASATLWLLRAELVTWSSLPTGGRVQAGHA